MEFGRKVHRLLDRAIRSSFRTGDARFQERGFVLRRFIPNSADRWTQRRPNVYSAVLPEGFSIPIVFERMISSKPHYQQGDMQPPPLSNQQSEEGELIRMKKKMLMKYQKNIHMEIVILKLSEISTSYISSFQFLQICSEVSEEGLELARSLSESRAVIILENIVLIKPEQLANALEIPRKEELKKMERMKEMIDIVVEDKVNKEIWCILTLFIAKMAILIRLTSWELSWDVVGTNCYFLFCFYILANYFFDLRTKTKSFFKRCYVIKQRRLMKKLKFDISRFNELKGVSCSSSPSRQTHHH